MTEQITRRFFLKSAPIVVAPIIAAMPLAASNADSEEGKLPLPPFEVLMKHMDTNRDKYIRPGMNREERKAGLANLLRSCPQQ